MLNPYPPTSPEAVAFAYKVFLLLCLPICAWVAWSDLKFMKFIGEEIFPGGQLPAVEDIEKLAADSNFTLERVHLLQPHYAKTLDLWAANLEANKDAAIAMQGQEIYDKYMRYLTGCADFFHRGITNVGQFTLAKGGATA